MKKICVKLLLESELRTFSNSLVVFGKKPLMSWKDLKSLNARLRSFLESVNLLRSNICQVHLRGLAYLKHLIYQHSPVQRTKNKIEEIIYKTAISGRRNTVAKIS